MHNVCVCTVVDAEVLSYYITCNHTLIPNPFIEVFVICSNFYSNYWPVRLSPATTHLRYYFAWHHVACCRSVSLSCLSVFFQIVFRPKLFTKFTDATNSVAIDGISEHMLTYACNTMAKWPQPNVCHATNWTQINIIQKQINILPHWLSPFYANFQCSGRTTFLSLFALTYHKQTAVYCQMAPMLNQMSANNWIHLNYIYNSGIGVSFGFMLVVLFSCSNYFLVHLYDKWWCAYRNFNA